MKSAPGPEIGSWPSVGRVQLGGRSAQTPGRQAPHRGILAARAVGHGQHELSIAVNLSKSRLGPNIDLPSKAMRFHMMDQLLFLSV